MNVLLGHNHKDRKKHCSDGDSVYITGSVHNELVRLLGIDAPEVRGLNLDKLEESKFLYVLDDNLLKYLIPKLTRKSIKIHKRLGFKAKEYLESILDENLTVTFGRETFDRYGRALVYLGDNQEMYNVTLVQYGFAIPYFIFPNAVPLTEEDSPEGSNFLHRGVETCLGTISSSLPTLSNFLHRGVETC